MKLLTHNMPLIYGGSYFYYQLLNYDEELTGSEYQALFSKICILTHFYPQELGCHRNPNILLFYTKWLRLILKACPHTYLTLWKTGQVPFFPLEVFA